MPRKKRLEDDEVTLRIAFKESDYFALLQRLDRDGQGWEHPVYWRLKAKWSEHLKTQEMK